MKKIIIAAFLIASTGLAECTYESNTAKVVWKAFKTYEKVGVGGSFDRANFTAQKSSSAEALLTSSTIAIDAMSVNSGNAGRDATLVSSFFKTQNIHTIAAKIISAKDSKAMTAITMNKVTKIIPMAYSVQEGKIVGKGVIDLADFTMMPSLQSINKTCFDLHAGKTWQDVEIGFEIPLKSDCQ